MVNDGRTSDATLLLVYEPEAACRARLLAEGLSPRHVEEIASYLAQSTDIQADLPALEDACAERRIRLRPLELDDAPAAIMASDPASTLVWTISDGIAYFRGGAAPALARLRGLRTFGCDDSLFALCQDKFRSGAVLRALGLPVPQAGLARGATWLVEPPPSRSGYFVKPNRLGAKIGIYPDSHCQTVAEALELAHRIYGAYRDDAVVQPYLPGQNVRASFLAVRPDSGPDQLGACFVDSGADFQTMADSLSLYGDTGAQARADGLYHEPELVPVSMIQPHADRDIRAIAGAMMAGLGLRDVFSMDLRVEQDGTIHLIEFEVCPGLPCFDFRAYCRAEWDMTLAEAMAESAAHALGSG